MPNRPRQPIQTLRRGGGRNCLPSKDRTAFVRVLQPDEPRLLSRRARRRKRATSEGIGDRKPALASDLSLDHASSSVESAISVLVGEPAQLGWLRGATATSQAVASVEDDFLVGVVVQAMLMVAARERLRGPRVT
jgi:hypothetical protein